MAEPKLEVDLQWIQDLSNEDRLAVTKGDGQNCPCPRCGRQIYHPLEGRKIKNDSQTVFTDRDVKHCREMIQFVVVHETTDIGEKVFLYAAPYRPKRGLRKRAF